MFRHLYRQSLAIAALIVCALAAATAAVAGPASAAVGKGRSIAELYHAALADGGHVILYAGGDVPGEFNATIHAFDTQFPGMKLSVLTDLSKYQDGRIDLQLADHDLEPDVAELQTTQDFTRWKQEGVLRAYKPLGWNHIERRYKDPTGAWVGASVLAFTDIVNPSLAGSGPIDYLDYLKPQFKDKIALTYPNDDDAVLYDWKLIVDRYGWSYVRRLMTQHPTFYRGTPASVNPLLAGTKAINFASLLPFAGVPGTNVKIELPRHDPFVSWAQRMAIFKQARHVAGAELLESWLVSKPVQETLPEWSVRSDVPPPAGIGPISDYNTNPSGFPKFMSNRGAVERFRNELTLYVGEPQGPDPAHVTGLGPFFPGITR